MPSQHYTPFQRHLLWYADPHPPHRLTILSALRGSLKLGFNLPYSLLLSILIRITYSPSLLPLSPFPVGSVIPSRSRTQLEHIPIKEDSYTQAELQALSAASPANRELNVFHRRLDRLHIWGWWAAAADRKTGRIDREAVERFQDGEWQGPVAQRRASRVRGKGEVLPFSRGGPISVTGHSWAVKQLLDVDVYRT